MFRIGHGYDVHRILHNSKKPLILGGIEIKSSFSLEAHSDGDVVLHAITDALFGASSLGDIGQHFSNNNSKYQGYSSHNFLLHANNCVKNTGYKISNIDVTLVAEEPKIAFYATKMRQNIANLLKLRINQISIKGTTTEKLGFSGRKEGVSCHAVALIYAS